MGFEKKIFSGGMDKDTEVRFLKPDTYRDALNIQAINTNTGSDGAIESIWGNSEVRTTLTSDDDVCIGSFEDKENNRIYTFWGDLNDATSAKIIRYDYLQEGENMQSTLLASGSGLGFSLGLGNSPVGKITGIAVVDNQYLYWTDDVNEPGKLIMTSEVLASNVYINQTDFRVFTAIPPAPLLPPSVYYTENNNDPDFNNLNNKLYQFKYRIVYKDGTKSAFSPISKVALPVSPESENFLNNRIVIICNLSTSWFSNSLKRLVDRIDVAARSNNLSDFEIIEQHEQDWVASGNAIINWENRDPTISLDVTESNALFSFVPLKAKSLELIDGNRLAYGNIVEGFNSVSVNASLSVDYTGNPSGFGTFPMTVNASHYRYTQDASIFDVIEFIGNANGYEVISITVTKTISSGIVEDKTVVLENANLGYTSNEIAVYFADQFTTYFNAQGDSLVSLFTFVPLTNRFLVKNNTIVVSGEGSANYRVTELKTYHRDLPDSLTSTVKSWKRGTYHKFGIVYYDFAGRPGLVQEFNDNEIYVQRPTGREPDASILYPTGQSRITMTINSRPPTWAYAYQILYGGNNTYASDPAEGNSFMYFMCHNSGITDIGRNRYRISLNEITNFTNSIENTGVTYSYVKGDKLKYIAKIKKNFSASQDLYYDAFSIDDIENDNEDLFFNVIEYDSSTNSIVVEAEDGGVNFTDSFTEWAGLFEIYHPVSPPSSDAISVSNQSLWYEIGEARVVLNPGTSSRYHSGSSQDQTNVLPAIVRLDSGDVYQKKRVMFNYDQITDKYKTNDSYYRNFGVFMLSVESQHYADTYNSNDYDFGRVNYVSKDEAQVRRRSSIRYSDIYIPDTNINGLGNFYDTDFMDYDKRFGSIQKMYSEDKKLIIFQELKVGQVFINESILQDSTGNILVQKSDSVLSDIQYYAGEYGISQHPESFAVHGYSKYFVDARRGAVLRLSNDGITEISQYGMRIWFADFFRDHENFEEFPLLCMGVYNIRNNEYVLALKDFNETAVGWIGDTYTLYFSEKANRWTSFASFKPDWLCQVQTDFLSFKQNQAWRHNNYDTGDLTYTNYNNFYGTSYDSEVTTVSNENPSNNKFYKTLEIESNVAPTVDSITNAYGQSSSIPSTLFKDKEGVYWSHFLRDVNTPNTTLPLYEGRRLRSPELLIKFVIDGTSYFKIFSVGFKYEFSELTNR